MGSKAGFGEDPAQRGFDLTQGYRDRNPYFDKGFVQRQLAPYEGAGLSQKLSDLRGKDDPALYDMAAKAVIKLAGLKPGQPPAPAPGPGPAPGPAPSPKPPKVPKPPRRRKPKPAPDPVPVGGNTRKIQLPEDKPPAKKPKPKPKPKPRRKPVPVGGNTRKTQFEY